MGPIAANLPLLLRELRIRLDLPDLEDVPLLVRRNQEQPLIGVRSLSLDDVAAQVVVRRAGVLQHLRVQHAQALQALAEIPQLALRLFRRDGLLAEGPVDAVPEDIGVRAGPLLAAR